MMVCDRCEKSEDDSVIVMKAGGGFRTERSETSSDFIKADLCGECFYDLLRESREWFDIWVKTGVNRP